MIHANIYGTLLLGFTGVIFADLLINLIYTVVGITDMLWTDYFIYRLLPTVLANLLFLIVLYPVFMKRLVTWRRELINRRSSILYCVCQMHTIMCLHNSILIF